MVGMATRVRKKPHRIVWGNSIGKNVSEWGQKLHRCCWKGFGPLTVPLFLKPNTKGDKTVFFGSLFQYFTARGYGQLHL